MTPAQALAGYRQFAFAHEGIEHPVHHAGDPAHPPVLLMPELAGLAPGLLLFAARLREAGFQVEPSVPNQGKGAAMIRVEALRRLGDKIWWNEATTEPGRNAIIHYQEKRDEERNVGLGPLHNWASHAADSLGMMACCYVEPSGYANFNRPMAYANQGWR